MMGCGRRVALLGLCVAVAGAWAQDEPPATQPQDVQFEFVNEPLGFCPIDAETWPEFVASFGLRRTPSGESRPARLACTTPELLDTPSGQKLSERQRALLASATCILLVPFDSTTPRGGIWYSPCLAYLERMKEGSVFRVCAVTEADARLMVHAMFEADAKCRQQETKSITARLEEARQSVNNAKEQLPKLTEVAHQVKEVLKQYTERTGYGSNESAQADMGELTRMLRSIDVEITGIRAKVDAIQQHKSQAITQDAGVLVALDRMLVEEDINLAGALARRKAVEDHLTEARIYCDQLYVSNSYDKRIADCNAKLKHGEAKVPALEKELADPPPYMRPLEVFENKVIIQPVK